MKQAERRARARQRATADPYAAVPARPAGKPVGRRPDDPVGDTPSPAPAPSPTRGKAPAAGRGRVAPPAHGPVEPSRAVRPQPAELAQVPIEAGQEVSDAAAAAREALERLVVDVPTSPSRAWCSRTSARCSPTTTGSRPSSRRWPLAGRDDDRRGGRRQGGRHGGARASSWRRRSRSRSGAGSSRCARRASCRGRPTPSPTPSSTARRRSSCSRSAIEPGERVLLVDDVLATGGTVAATVRADRAVRRRTARVHGADGARLPRRPRQNTGDLPIVSVVTL